MATLPFALSVHSFINSIGADAGFASIIGLAILVLLYFAQARETATLRDRLDEAAHRAAALEARLAQVAQLSRGAPAVAPPPAVAAAARPTSSAVASVRRPAEVAGVGGGGTVPGRTGLELPGPLIGAPAGVGAPPTGSVTRKIPMPQAVPVPAPAVGGAPAPALAPVGAAGPAEDTMLVPATVAAGANGHGSPPAVVGPPTVPAPVGAGAPPPRVQIRQGDDPVGLAGGPGVATGGPGARASDAGTRAGGAGARAAGAGTRAGGAGARAGGAGARAGGAQGGRPGSGARPSAAARRPLSPLRDPASREPGVPRRIIPGLIGLGAAIVIVVVLIVITGNGGTKTVAHHPSRAATARHHRAKAPVFSPASVTVAVLNGTAVNNLAHSVALELTNTGYTVPGTMVATAADQTHVTTVVGYTPGHEAAAVHVARSLKLSRSSVQPADTQALGVACSTATATTCPADVVVTVGNDLQSAATTTPASGTTTG